MKRKAKKNYWERTHEQRQLQTETEQFPFTKLQTVYCEVKHAYMYLNFPALCRFCCNPIESSLMLKMRCERFGKVHFHA